MTERRDEGEPMTSNRASGRDRQSVRIPRTRAVDVNCQPAESLADDVPNASVAGRDSVVGDALIWMALHCQHTKPDLLLVVAGLAAVSLAERAALTSGDWPCMAVVHGCRGSCQVRRRMTTEEWI